MLRYGGATLAATDRSALLGNLLISILGTVYNYTTTERIVVNTRLFSLQTKRGSMLPIIRIAGNIKSKARLI